MLFIHDDLPVLIHADGAQTAVARQQRDLAVRIIAITYAAADSGIGIGAQESDVDLGDINIGSARGWRCAYAHGTDSGATGDGIGSDACIRSIAYFIRIKVSEQSYIRGIRRHSTRCARIGAWRAEIDSVSRLEIGGAAELSGILDAQAVRLRGVQDQRDVVSGVSQERALIEIAVLGDEQSRHEDEYADRYEKLYQSEAAAHAYIVPRHAVIHIIQNKPASMRKSRICA